MNRFAIFSIILGVISVVCYLIISFFGKGQKNNNLDENECNKKNNNLEENECQYFDYNEELCLVGKKNGTNCIPKPNVIGKILLGTSVLSLFGSIIFLIIFLKTKNII